MVSLHLLIHLVINLHLLLSVEHLLLKTGCCGLLVGQLLHHLQIFSTPSLQLQKRPAVLSQTVTVLVLFLVIFLLQLCSDGMRLGAVDFLGQKHTLVDFGLEDFIVEGACGLGVRLLVLGFAVAELFNQVLTIVEIFTTLIVPLLLLNRHLSSLDFSD